MRMVLNIYLHADKLMCICTIYCVVVQERNGKGHYLILCDSTKQVAVVTVSPFWR